MKKLFNFFLIIYFLCTPVLAYDLDTSIDDEIRRNYNPSKIEQDMALPALPPNLQNSQNSIPVNQYQPTTKTSTQYLQPISAKPKYSSKVSVDGSYAVLKKGTKFSTKLVNSVSDRTRKKTTVTLVTQYPVSTTYLTIPRGTLLEGEITCSHPPQFTGNGGLIVMQINSIILNGEPHQINGFVTEANFRNIFFNNIKGERKYAKSLINAMRPGFQFYKRMFSTSARLLNDGGAAFWSPFPLAAGIAGFGANVMVSPVMAAFQKGGTVYLRSGSHIQIKLAQDVIIYN